MPKTYKVQNLDFELLPTTPANRRAFDEIGKERARKARERSQALDDYIDGKTDEEPDLPEYEDQQYLFNAFCAITKGEHEKLDYEQFDAKVSEVAIEDFLPAATATEMRRRGYLPSRRG